jgi:hypothetical protein
MDTIGWIILAAAAVVLVLVLAAVLLGRRRARRRRLQQRFGDEYDRTVEAHDERRRPAERDLVERERTRERLDLRPLTPAARDRYAAQWEAIQAGFVDRPETSVRAADELVEEVMRERGYPVEDFEAQADVISVDYPHVVEDYRAAHGIATAADGERAPTEDLRVAIVRFRSLFESLLDGHGDAASTDEHEPDRRRASRTRAAG